MCKLDRLMNQSPSALPSGKHQHRRRRSQQLLTHSELAHVFSAPHVFGQIGTFGSTGPGRHVVAQQGWHDGTVRAGELTTTLPPAALVFIAAWMSASVIALTDCAGTGAGGTVRALSWTGARGLPEVFGPDAGADVPPPVADSGGGDGLAPALLSLLATGTGSVRISPSLPEYEYDEPAEDIMFPAPSGGDVPSP